MPEREKGRLARVIAEALTPCQREVLLRYYAGESIPKIAGDRGVNKSTISRTLHRAERRVRERMRY